MEKKEHKNWGGARKGAGHPATGINYKCLTLTLSIKQADELRMYAANEGLTVSQFVAEKCGLSPKEQKMLDRVIKTWYNYLSGKQ